MCSVRLGEINGDLLGTKTTCRIERVGLCRSPVFSGPHRESPGPNTVAFEEGTSIVLTEG